MAAMKSSLYGITIFVVFQLLFVVCNGEGDYDEYDVINQCRFRESLYHHLGSTKWSTLSLEYLSSVLKLKIPRHSLSLDDINCKLMITPFSPSLGTVLNFVDSRGSSEWDCTNFLEVTTYKSGNYSKTEDVCKYANVKPLTFDSTTGSTLLFHFNQSLTPENPQFTIYATAYIHDCNSSDVLFRCTNNRCIYPGFKCDGVNNCGDNSDEDNCGRSLIDPDDDVYKDWSLDESSASDQGGSGLSGWSLAGWIFLAIFCLFIRYLCLCKLRPYIRGLCRDQCCPPSRDDISDGTPPYATLSEETGVVSGPPPPYRNVVTAPKLNSQPV